MGYQASASFPLLINVLVDGLRAYVDAVGTENPVCNLLRTPIHPDLLFDDGSCLGCVFRSWFTGFPVCHDLFIESP